MTKADTIFKENIRKIMEEGVWSEQARPKYKDGTVLIPSTSRVPLEFDLAKVSSRLRPFALSPSSQLSRKCFGSIKISPIAWMLLMRSTNVHYWSDWEVGDIQVPLVSAMGCSKKHDIINKILKQLEANPWNRRNIISLGTTKPLRRQKAFYLVPFKPCLMSVVSMGTFIWMQL